MCESRRNEEEGWLARVTGIMAQAVEMALPETEASITVKINRGAFPAWFLFAVTRAIGAHTLRLE